MTPRPDYHHADPRVAATTAVVVVGFAGAGLALLAAASVKLVLRVLS